MTKNKAPDGHDDGKPRCGWCGTDPLYVQYHDTEWGVPESDDRALRSEEHTSELQSLMRISSAVFCLQKKKKTSRRRCSRIVHSEATEADMVLSSEEDKED